MLEDKKWNKIYMSECTKWIKFILRFADTSKYPVTQWYFRENCFFCTRDKSKHLLRVNNSYWFNYMLLEYLRDTYGDIIIEVTEQDNDNKKRLFTTVLKVLNYKRVKQFNLTGFELQTFLPLTEFRETRYI